MFASCSSQLWSLLLYWSLVDLAVRQGKIFYSLTIVSVFEWACGLRLWASKMFLALDIFWSGYFPPQSTRNMRGFFLDLHRKNLVGFKFMAPADYAPVKLVTSIIFHIHLYLQVTGCDLPCEINYLMGPRVVIYFQFVQHFCCWEHRNDGFLFLYVTRGWSFTSEKEHCSIWAL